MFSGSAENTSNGLLGNCAETTLDRRCDMLQWIVNWAARHAPTVEQHAHKAMPELRMALFQAEQRILDAQVQAEYYRSRLAFCESVLKNGIEQVSDLRREPQSAAPILKAGPVLTTAKSA
jgi:hypothetical protein